jgi:hypothetical protein
MSGARRASRSIGAVLAGLATVFLLSLGTDALLAVAAQAIPCAWAGGALRQMQSPSPALGGVA